MCVWWVCVTRPGVCWQADPGRGGDWAAARPDTREAGARRGRHPRRPPAAVAGAADADAALPSGVDGAGVPAPPPRLPAPPAPAPPAPATGPASRGDARQFHLDVVRSGARGAHRHRDAPPAGARRGAVGSAGRVGSLGSACSAESAERGAAGGRQRPVCRHRASAGRRPGGTPRRRHAAPLRRRRAAPLRRHPAPRHRPRRRIRRQHHPAVQRRHRTDDDRQLGAGEQQDERGSHARIAGQQLSTETPPLPDPPPPPLDPHETNEGPQTCLDGLKRHHVEDAHNIVVYLCAYLIPPLSRPRWAEYTVQCPRTVSSLNSTILSQFCIPILFAGASEQFPYFSYFFVLKVHFIFSNILTYNYACVGISFFVFYLEILYYNNIEIGSDNEDERVLYNTWVCTFLIS